MPNIRPIPDASVRACNRAASQKLADLSLLILVVDDHDDSRVMIRCLLEMRGYRVIEAVDGLDAIGKAQSERPDLILMDVGLPMLDGLSATRRIREDIELRELPVVAISGYAAVEDVAKAQAAGCVGYITKPINFEELDRVLRYFLPGDRIPSRLQTKAI